MDICRRKGWRGKDHDLLLRGGSGALRVVAFLIADGGQFFVCNELLSMQHKFAACYLRVRVCCEDAVCGGVAASA